MWTTIATALIGVALQVATPPAPSSQNDRIVQVSLVLNRGAEGPRSFATLSRNGDEGFAGHMASFNLCDLYSGGNAPAGAATVAWRVAGRTVQQSGDEFRVEVEWQRLWTNGVRASDAPTVSKALTLRLGDRVLLDSFVPATPSACGTLSADLTIGVIDVRTLPVAARARAGGGGGGGGRGGTSGSGAGPVSGAGRGGGRGGAGAVATGEVTAAPIAPATHDAELWLVHRLPSGIEEVIRTVSGVGESARPFGFPSVEVGGTFKLAVDVTGRLQILPGTGKAPQLLVTIQRHVRSAGLPPHVPSSSGGSGKIIPLPPPADVIAFELPLVPGEARALGDHAFSLRLRLTAR